MEVTECIGVLTDPLDADGVTGVTVPLAANVRELPEAVVIGRQVENLGVERVECGSHRVVSSQTVQASFLNAGADEYHAARAWSRAFQSISCILLGRALLSAWKSVVLLGVPLRIQVV